MTMVYSLDEIARTSDEAVVKARFDASTLTALRVLSAGFAVMTLVHLGEVKTVLQIILRAAAFSLAAILFVLVRKRAGNAVARFVRQRARATAIAFLLVEATALFVFNASAGSEAAVALAVVLPFAAVLIRLLPAEHLLLHASLAAIFSLTVFAMPADGRNVAEMIMPVVATNAAAVAVALFISRRRRRAIVREWSERRAGAREQIRMRDELLLARELQLSMLPECAPSLEWAEICSASVPATEVGGDYYDYFVDADRVALICLDVAGHGMASGLVLSSMRGALTVMRDELRDPAAALRRLHELVLRSSRRRTLVTISMVLLERQSRRAVVASAGNPPVMVRHADGSVDVLALDAPPLGVRLPLEFRAHESTFLPGDVFVLHTDGVYETRNANGDAYGLDPLQRLISEKGGGAAEGLRDSILNDLAAFRGQEEQHDDVTVVVCRMR